MRSLKHHVVAAATALVALASPAFTQVSNYREIKPPPLRSFTVAQPKRVELANGMVIFLQEDHELPLIRGSALIHGGSRDVPADKAGLVGILAGSWRTGGTESKTGDQLDDVLESRAARVETTGSEDATRVSLDVLKNDFDFVFPIFIEILQKPAFRQEKIDLAKTQARTAISRRNDEPQVILFREAQKLGYGPDSPYARQPEYATINAITRDDLLAFHKRFVHPNNIVFGIVGDFDTATMEKKLRGAFSSWPRGMNAPAAPAVNAAAKSGVYYVTKDDVTQAGIAAIHPAALLRRDPDYYAVEVMNEILNGGFSGRLMNDIRSKAGLAYAVGGGLGAGWDRPMLFNAFMTTKSPSTIQSIDLLKGEISDLQTKPFTTEELQHAKDTLLNRFVFTVDSKAKVLNQRQQLEFYGYPADYWQKYQKGIESVTAGDVERVAKKYVHPDQLAILVVGNQKEFEKPLATAYGRVTPIDVTIPEPGAKPAAAAAPAASSSEGTALVKKVQGFIGGKAAIDKVQAVREVATMTRQTPQGSIEMEIEEITRFPDSHRQVIKMPMGEMTVVFTPDSGFMSGPMGTQDLPSSQRAAAQSESRQGLLTVLKNVDNPAYTFTVTGSEKVGDINAQVLEVNAGGSTFKWNIDPATGRILRKVAQSRMGEQITEYTEWKTFGDLNLPVAFTLTAGGQQSGAGKLTTVEINPTVDPKAFEKPAK